MKRKAGAVETPAFNGASEKGVHAHFRQGLFQAKTINSYASEYANSAPYRHAVVQTLIADSLLRSVRAEIIDNVHFTPKETDIYRIHQSGDLANLDGLPAEALRKLPSLLTLRDALYSRHFRQWVSAVTGLGPVSGSRTDMAVNVYAPGCHLLCHDDVIGSRSLSYILYLTDPDKPWRAEWGGALRLYPTDEARDEEGKAVKLPRAEWSKPIPPAWNQLTFFAVQPGESFHDVEEVYKRCKGGECDDGGRIRMAISGWYHIPQQGEEGYEPGLEERLAAKSSLQQLQGRADQFDQPQLEFRESTLLTNGSTKENDDSDEAELSESDLQFLLNYITPNYLTPDTVDELNELFAEESTLQLANFLSKNLAARLRTQLENGTMTREFKTSRPPHKHRYQYLSASPTVRPPPVGTEDEPCEDLLYNLLPSQPFRKWLSLATGLTLRKCAVLARRFRRGLDYQLAQGYKGENPQLEYCLCVTPTPTPGWGDQDDEGTEAEDSEANHAANGRPRQEEEEEEDYVGGYEAYMADDADDDNEAVDGGSLDRVTKPATLAYLTGAGEHRSTKRRKADPAVYQSAAEDEDEDSDDGILSTSPACWNTLTIVLRDRGVLKFVKYVSRAATGDRFDFAGCVEVKPELDEDEADEGDGAVEVGPGAGKGVVLKESV